MDCLGGVGCRDEMHVQETYTPQAARAFEDYCV